VPEDIVPIDDDELLYRRISVLSGWCDGSQVSPPAFHPQKHDKSGISVFRARFRSIESAATGPSPDGYFVAVLCAGELRARGIQIEPQPDLDGDYDVSHAELPQLNTGRKKSPEIIQLKAELIELAMKRSVEGPFKIDAGGAE